jgi:acyl-CoA synthetase (AMP-forming)/AMP-acid ligase II
MTREKQLALVRGSSSQELWSKSLGEIIAEKATSLGDKELAIFPWQDVRLSYRQLAERGELVAAALLRAGIRHSDCIGIMAGNRHEYLEVVIGATSIGCHVLTLNTTYKPWELRNALQKTCERSESHNIACHTN